MYARDFPGAHVCDDARHFDFTQWRPAKRDGDVLVLAACTPCKPVADSGRQLALDDPDIFITVGVAPRAAEQLDADVVLMEQHYQIAVLHDGAVLKAIDDAFAARGFHRGVPQGTTGAGAEIVRASRSPTTRLRVAMEYHAPRFRSAHEVFPALVLDGPRFVLDDILESDGAICAADVPTGDFMPHDGWEPPQQDQMLAPMHGLVRQSDHACRARVAFVLDANLLPKSFQCWECEPALLTQTERAHARERSAHAARFWARDSSPLARARAAIVARRSDAEARARERPLYAGTFVSGGAGLPLEPGSWVQRDGPDARIFVLYKFTSAHTATLFFDDRRRPEYVRNVDVRSVRHVPRVDDVVCSSSVAGVLTSFGPPPWHGLKHLVYVRGKVRALSTTETFRVHGHDGDVELSYRAANPLAGERDLRAVVGKGLVRELADAMAQRAVDQVLQCSTTAQNRLPEAVSRCTKPPKTDDSKELKGDFGDFERRQVVMPSELPPQDRQQPGEHTQDACPTLHGRISDRRSPEHGGRKSGRDSDTPGDTDPIALDRLGDVLTAHTPATVVDEDDGVDKHVALILVNMGSTPARTLVSEDGGRVLVCEDRASRRNAVDVCERTLRELSEADAPICFLAGSCGDTFVVVCPLAHEHWSSCHRALAWHTLDELSERETYAHAAMAVATASSMLTHSQIRR